METIKRLQPGCRIAMDPKAQVVKVSCINDESFLPWCGRDRVGAPYLKNEKDFSQFVRDIAKTHKLKLIRFESDNYPVYLLVKAG